MRRGPLRADLQRRAGAAAAHRHGRRVRRRRALPRLAAGLVPASDHRRPRAAGLRPGRHLDAALAGRLPVPRRPSGRAQLRDLPGQRLRGREPAPGALLPPRPHAGPADGRAARAQRRSFRSRWTCAGSTLMQVDSRPATTAVRLAQAQWLVPLPRLSAAPHLRRAARRARACRVAHWRQLARPSAALHPGAVRQRQALLGAADPRKRRHLQRLCRPEGRRPPVGARPAAAASSRPTSGRAIEAGVAQRAPLLNAMLADLYGPQRLLAEGLLPAGAGLRPPRLPVALPRRAAAGRRLAAPLRGRPGALAGWPLVGDGRPHAGAVGRRLRAGEPADRLARVFPSCSATCACSASPASSATLQDTLRALGAARAARRRWSCC